MELHEQLDNLLNRLIEALEDHNRVNQRFYFEGADAVLISMLTEDGYVEERGEYGDPNIYVTLLGLDFSRRGGYSEKHRRETRDQKKADHDAWLSGWKRKTFPYVFAFGIAGGIAGFGSLIIDVIQYYSIPEKEQDHSGPINKKDKLSHSNESESTLD